MYTYGCVEKEERHNWRTAQLSRMGTDLAHNSRVYSYRAFHIALVRAGEQTDLFPVENSIDLFSSARRNLLLRHC